MFGKPKKQVVGCDVGSSAIKIVELKPLKSGEFQLLHAAIADLSPEAIVDGAIMDSSLVVEALSRLIAENNIKNSNFGGSLSGHSVIIKKIQLPSMTGTELGECHRHAAKTAQTSVDRFMILSPFDLTQGPTMHQAKTEELRRLT